MLSLSPFIFKLSYYYGFGTITQGVQVITSIDSQAPQLSVQLLIYVSNAGILALVTISNMY